MRCCGAGRGGAYYRAGYDSQYQGNIMYCLNSRQVIMQQNNSWADEYDNAVDFGNFTNNFYFNPFSDVPILRRFHYNVSGVTPYLSARVVPMSFEYWQGLGEDHGSTKSPLKAKDFEIGGTSGTIAELSDDLESGDGDWIASNSECDKDGLDLSLEGGTGNALRNTDCFWIEHKSYNAFAIVDPPVGIGEIASGTYRYTFRLRSTDTDALQFCPQYAEGKYRDPQFVALTSEWKDHEFVIDVVDEHGDDYLFTSFQNVWYSLAAQGTSAIDIDNIVAQPCSLNAAYPDQIAADHILHFHDPLADDPYEPLELVGCWADVRNNIYTGTVTLAPWESIVLYRLSSDFASLPLDGNGEYHITGTEVWNTNRNVQGSIVVEDGGTLIVDGAIIGFAESTLSLTTNIIVERGGTLIVRNNGHLTSLVDCDDPVMWDGVKVLGNGSDSGSGEAHFQSGARVSNALTAVRCADGSPTDPLNGNTSTGGIVVGEDAIFENNRFDIVTRPHTSAAKGWGTSKFTNCQFRHTRALNDPSIMGWVNVTLSGSVGMQFTSCTFEDLSGLRSTSGALLGIGIHTFNTRIQVKDNVAGDRRGRFEGLGTGILHSPFTPANHALVEGCDFIGNARGALITGSNNGSMNRCTFLVADEDVSELNVPAAHGSYFYGCSGFQFEDNIFIGANSTTFAKVGAVFRNSGTADNVFYNNTFDRFNDIGEQSCGTIIMGTNAHSTTGVGLRIKCNDYSPSNTNDFDVAFTGSSVTIADDQGAFGTDTQDPAGNTFADTNPITCGGNAAQHFFVDNTVNTFEYYHHDPGTTSFRVVPDCADSPITPSTWYSNTSWDYDKPISCPSTFSEELLFSQLVQRAAEGHAMYGQRHAAYMAWKDDGDTEGLLAYVRNGTNGSAAVRDRLIQKAPKVGAESWAEAFSRVPAMNPWHLAQALIANSPLEPKVLALMDEYGLATFYKQLVLDGQGGGPSMHSIRRSEIAMAHARRSVGLNQVVRNSLQSGDSTTLSDALQALSAYGGGTMERQQLALYHALGDYSSARALVTTKLEENSLNHAYWQVQALVLEKLDDGTPLTDLDGGEQQFLQEIVVVDGPGAAEAAAWLALLGHEFTEMLILPTRTKRNSNPVKEEGGMVNGHPVLAAYPNPSNGPVYITYQVPEGVQQTEVRMHDAHGVLVFAQRIAARNGIVEVPPNNLAAGLHVVSLYYDGIHVGTAKVNMMR